ncbi:phytanoyl-CoA dioxygenase family protein [Pseudoalteromonas luteoviolacea]|uniref:phytanoyl-CoA dioxygenase family protein n=1 Tax=Pseudoalteromonas luteoviolacea TaxID=43657 RepID=UPI001F333A93|nr:phytanoyl-CoA dioxygenase family protein [Pseudoalteromonas luteoviolacea]MCF6442117.1 phytanoyl-CoA dioxygenase family protein [Pseudoalteromonas luteoviolacea]
MNISENGFEILESFLSQCEMQSIKAEVNEFPKTYPKYGIRGANDKFQTIQQLCSSEKLTKMAESILMDKANLVRVIFFDKTPEYNWLVTWHQDKTICVNTKADIEGWKAWSIKDGKHHVQPSIDVLNKMAAFRIHLDDCDEDNGCLKVIPNSHKLGILTQNEIDSITQNQPAFSCVVKAGDALIIRPHLLHSSSKSNNPSNRRVVHIEFSSYQLPCNLDWA